MLNALNVAHTGLIASKTAVEGVSNNIANSNTKGYKKRVIDLHELSSTDGSLIGRGVTSNNAYRITSEYMYDNLLTETSKANYYNEISRMVGNIESVLKETDSSGFSSDFNRYFQAIENLRSNPNSQIYKTTLKTQANILVESIKNLYTAIEKEEALTKKSLDDNIKEVNTLIHEIGQVNKEIQRSSTVSNDLLDKRDELEVKLAKYVDIKVDRRDDDYQLRIGGQIAIRYNTNIRDIKIIENKTHQVDKYNVLDANENPISSTHNAVFDNNDTFTFKLNNEHEVQVEFGTYVVDASGNNVDLDGDGNADLIDNNNYIRALKYKINNDEEMSQLVNAYNGNYAFDENNNKVDSNSSDKFLVLESTIKGLEGKFDGRISLIEKIGTVVSNRDAFYKNDIDNKKATQGISISIFGKEVSLKKGIIQAQTDNLTSTSSNNKIIDYKNKMNDFARALSDITNKYVKIDNNYNYVHGHAASDEYDGDKSIKSIGLFNGSSVKTLKFNENLVNDLDQSDLDYLSKHQWKKDIGFDGKAQNGSHKYATSFTEFFQEIRVNVASDKENNEFLLTTQKAIRQSLQNYYDQIVKVDQDEEMMNLIKFQAAYTANAKIITVVDEMLDTLLRMN